MFWMCYRDMLVFILAVACDAWLMIKQFVAPLTCKIARWQMTGQPEIGTSGRLSFRVADHPLAGNSENADVRSQKHISDH